MTDDQAERLEAIEAQHRELNEWLFTVAPGDKKSRAEMIMETCRDWSRTQDRARFAVRLTVAVFGALGGWYAGAGEIIAKIFKAG